METKRINGETWYDTDGNILHAHGGHMLKWEDNWYWYGENRTDNRYVSVYKSGDLINWTFCRHALTADFPHGRTPCQDRSEAAQRKRR